MVQGECRWYKECEWYRESECNRTLKSLSPIYCQILGSLVHDISETTVFDPEKVNTMDYVLVHKEGSNHRETVHPRPPREKD